MTKLQQWILAAVAGCAWMGGHAQVSAQTLAFDDATAEVYADGWDEGDNGGTGFLPWTGGMYGNPLVVDAAPEPDNNLGAPAFQLGTGGFGYWAIRPFANSLQPGQSFKMDIDPFAFQTDTSTTGDFQSLIRFGAGGSDNAHEAFALYTYTWYTNGVVEFGADKWGVVAETTNDGLNGGAPLPTTPCFATGCTNYSMLDSSDGFTMVFDLITTDTYRLRVFDDETTKLDVSGQLDPILAAAGINQLVLYSDDGSAGSIDSTYLTNLEIYVTPSEGLAGDFNDDGEVDAADYTVWRDNFGGNSSVLNGNGSGAATVVPADYDLWKSQFGMPGAGAGSIGGSTVPEPSALVGILLGMYIGALGRTRR